MKTIALFGATGLTGGEFLAQALTAGYVVRALVRTPSKLKQSHQNLHVIEGDVLSLSNVEATIASCDVVVSLFGHVKGSPAWLQTDGTKNIVAAMQKHGIGKVISLSGGGLPYPTKDQPKFADKLIRAIMKIAVPKILNDAIAHHTVLAHSDLDWIIVRGPRLTMAPRTGSYRVGWVGVNASTHISRGDLAAFILTQIDDTTFHRQMPFVSH